MNFGTLVLQIVFWLSAAAVVYTYAGYPLLITFLARFIHRPIRRAPMTPRVTLIIPAYNEESVIAEKIENSLALDYPRDCLQMIVAADGSTDRTCEIVRAFETRGIQLLHQPARGGKIAAINRSVPFATGENLVFSDANAMIEPQAIRALMASFADPQVACVGGAKRITSAASLQAQGEGTYWRYEAYLKRLDSELNTAIGAVGEFFAVRRELFQPLDTDLIIEDFVMTMRLVAQGWRVVYEPAAITWEQATPSLRGEWQRRSRNAAGSFQAMIRLARLSTPLRGLTALQYVSHKVLRWLTPFFMIAAFGANLGLLDLTLYRAMFVIQLMFYGLAVLGFVFVQLHLQSWPLQLPFYFCFANAAGLAGFGRFITRAQTSIWKKAR